MGIDVVRGALFGDDNFMPFLTSSGCTDWYTRYYFFFYNLFLLLETYTDVNAHAVCGYSRTEEHVDVLIESYSYTGLP